MDGEPSPGSRHPPQPSAVNRECRARWRQGNYWPGVFALTQAARTARRAPRAALRTLGELVASLVNCVYILCAV